VNHVLVYNKCKEMNQDNIDRVTGRKPKLSMLNAMLQCKCPRCTEGDMFTHSAFNLSHFNEVAEQCEVCGLRFEVEPGFYQGSMFFTYAFNVAFSIVFGFGAYYVFNDPPLWVYYVAILVPVVLTVPWVIRYSKVMMLYFFGDVWKGRK
jgi:uncharacterized protein (DUF983 family)